MSGNKKVQRITVLVIIGAVVISLALSLLSGAGALGLSSAALMHDLRPPDQTATGILP